ncbi:MAG: hypothetical protein LBU90_03785 [Bacteroidales bacterium]|jgi:hypothetical protein|nr:hypothetical protein [Bacteroidales bacterium]
MFGLETLLKSSAGKKQIKKLLESEILPQFLPSLEAFALERIKTMQAESKNTVSFMAFPVKDTMYVGTVFLDENKTILRMENVQPAADIVKQFLLSIL